jgi:N-acetylglutamate synthase-like GNAT family acetyltransferase
MTGAVRVIPWRDDLAADFRDINVEWVSAMFEMEAMDYAQLDDPKGTILERGGAILFAKMDDLGVIGTGALMKAGERAYEVAKMGVRPAAQGRGAGDALLTALIAEARARDATELFLLTNARCAAAVRLYERAGFVHDADVMARYGAEYARCDVAMRFPL